MIKVNNVEQPFEKDLTVEKAVNNYYSITGKGKPFPESYYVVLNDEFLSTEDVKKKKATKGSVINIYRMISGG